MASFDRDVLQAIAREREIELTTFGRRSGAPSRRVLWIVAENGRVYVRSGGGLGRDWPQNLLANARGVLYVAGRDVPVRARHVTDPEEARGSTAMVARKYGTGARASASDEPLTPGESACFELLMEEDDGTKA
jgi:deazaflavin-dependent oxidoreductase (nitroreductase family)